MSSLATWAEHAPLSEEEMAAILAEGERRQASKEAVDAERDRRRHPLTRLMSNVASGSIPNGPELDALKLSAGDRRKLEDAISTVSETQNHGENQAARDLADELGAEIFAGLPADQQAADYLDEPVVDSRGPDELAADVRGR